MDKDVLKSKVCKGVEASGMEEEERKIEKVLAPFMKTLKKRKHTKTNVLPVEYKETYLKRHPKELLSKLQTSFTDPLSVRTLLHETAELLKVVTHSKSVNIYLTDYVRGEILLCPKQIVGNDRFEKIIAIGTGTYVAAYVADTKEYVIAGDILGDVRFPDGILNVGTTVKSVLCLPVITNVQENCIGIIELYRDCSTEPYDLVNLQICTALTAWMGIAMEQNNLRLKILKEQEIQKAISRLAELYFSGTVPFDETITQIVKMTKMSVNAERGSFYFFDESVSPYSEEILEADAFEEGCDDDEGFHLFKKRKKIRFVKNEPGIPGYVARSGEVLNIHNAYKDYRFDRKSDSSVYRSRSIMALPVKNNLGVVGVLQLVNNIEYPYFRKEDEDLIRSYINHLALICGYFLLTQENKKMMLKEVVKIRLLDYHTKPPADDILALKTFSQGETLLPDSFFTFDWNTSNLEDDFLKYIAYVLMNPGMLESIFDHMTLADFLIRVRKSYRPVVYHNFEHAFCVFHCAYNIIIMNKDVFTPAEVVAIFLAALCHDVDHCGMTNSFLSLKNDVIYQIYGDYCGELHRYDVTMFLIQSTDLLSNVSYQNYEAICKNLQKLFLGFDMALHFQARNKTIELLNSNCFDWDDPEHRYLAQNMILISADHSGNFKSFEVVKKITSNFYKEMFRQGDLEKSMGFAPLPILDRNKTETIPDNQVIFLTAVVCPSVEVVVTLFPNLNILMDLLTQTVAKWREVIALRGQEMWKVNHALVKDKKEKKSRRVTLSSTLSSLRTIIS